MLQTKEYEQSTEAGKVLKIRSLLRIPQGVHPNTLTLVKSIPDVWALKL